MYHAYTQRHTNKNTYNLFKLLSLIQATTERDFKKSHHTKYANISYLEHQGGRRRHITSWGSETTLSNARPVHARETRRINEKHNITETKPSMFMTYKQLHFSHVPSYGVSSNRYFKNLLNISFSSFHFTSQSLDMRIQSS